MRGLIIVATLVVVVAMANARPAKETRASIPVYAKIEKKMIDDIFTELHDKKRNADALKELQKQKSARPEEPSGAPAWMLVKPKRSMPVRSATEKEQKSARPEEPSGPPAWMLIKPKRSMPVRPATQKRMIADILKDLQAMKLAHVY